MTLYRGFRGVGLSCDLCVRVPLGNQSGDRPLLTCEIRVSKQQRHYLRPFGSSKLAILHKG